MLAKSSDLGRPGPHPSPGPAREAHSGEGRLNGAAAGNRAHRRRYIGKVYYLLLVRAAKMYQAASPGAAPGVNGDMSSHVEGLCFCHG